MSHLELRKELEAKLPKIKVGKRTLFLLEQDVLVTLPELDKYALELYANNLRRAAGMLLEKEARLVIATDENGVPTMQKNMPMLYCVDKHTFTDEQAASVTASIEQATKDWSDVCGVTFKRIEPKLFNCQAYFRVRFQDCSGKLIAAAFFPDAPKIRRVIIIDPSYFSPSLGYDKVGVLRHELGHVLGFRHEHARAEASPTCPQEDMTHTQPLTQYDSKSVMHYICANVGDPTFKITENDVFGARYIYGLPKSNSTRLTQ